MPRVEEAQPGTNGVHREGSQVRPLAEWYDPSRDQFEKEIVARHEPAILRGLVAAWPAVTAARESTADLKEYLSRIDRGMNVRAFIGPSEMRGRFFYNREFDGFNFGVVETELQPLLTAMVEGAAGRHVYMGSTPTAQLLPGFAGENPLDLLDGKPTEPRVWIGTDSVVAPHFDESDNIACVVSGRRKFTLFPPDQVSNLYVGPIDNTMAGQPASLVDLDNPDFEQFPRFREALDHALIAELEPGDAVYIPALWWHGVRASGPLNVLVNYWWQDTPLDAGSPMIAIASALLSVGLLPEHKRHAWRNLFDHFVFKTDSDPVAHIPEHARGVLSRSTPELRRVLRDFVVRALQRK